MNMVGQPAPEWKSAAYVNGEEKEEGEHDGRELQPRDENERGDADVEGAEDGYPAASELRAQEVTRGEVIGGAVGQAGECDESREEHELCAEGRYASEGDRCGCCERRHSIRHCGS